MVATQSVRDGSDTEQDGGPCRHKRMRWVRDLRRGTHPELDCDQPVLWVCRCGYGEPRRCQRTKESRCVPCSRRYGRRVRRIASSGTERTWGFHYFLTVTALGESEHCFVRGCKLAPHCAHPVCPCTSASNALSSPELLARWNAGHSARWNHLRTLLRREYPGMEFMRGVEPQDGKRRKDGQGRGALHDHVMVWSPQPMRREVVKELAMRAGFGHEVKMPEVRPGSTQAAYYVAKYVTKATDARTRVPWWGDVIDYRTGEVTEGMIDARYRTWSSSRSWGLTMKAVKRDCAEFARAKRAEEVAALLLLLRDELGAVELPSDEPVPSAPT